MTKEWLLMKRGLYYRPDNCGYTGIKDHAGRYSLEEMNESVRAGNGVTGIHEAGAPEFTTSCFDDLARDHLTKQRDEATAAKDAEIDRLQTELSHAGQWREAYTKEIEQLRAAQDEADALIMELIGLPFPVAYPTGSTKATAMLSWGARCTERGNQQSTTTEKSNG